MEIWDNVENKSGLIYCSLLVGFLFGAYLLQEDILHRFTIFSICMRYW